VNKEQSVIR